MKNMDAVSPKILFAALTLILGLQVQAQREDQATITYGNDHNIKTVIKGRAGNLELGSTEAETGKAQIRYQEGSGYVEYDRERQIFKAETKIPWTLNRLSKNIEKKAPYINLDLPAGAELDFNLDVKSLGYGTLKFEDLNLNRFRFDVSHGDVDINFVTENQSIVRGTAKFHLSAGDLEIENLANLKAEKIKINGGVGELSVNFGPRLFHETDVVVDMDIGTAELTIPRGTRVEIRGTSRDFTAYGMHKEGDVWVPDNYNANSPLLKLKLKGPLGDLILHWQ